jgi:CheY-like chemotaxis protein
MGSDPKRSPATILVAEDNEILLRILRRALEHEGYLVLEATSGAELLEQLVEARPDLIVLDVGLPDADGRDLLAKLKSEPATARIPVIVWSGSGGDSDQQAVLELGAAAFVQKGPADPLVSKIQRILIRVTTQPPPTE